MDCETCIYFDLHPFIREYDWTNYCLITDKPIDEKLTDCKNYIELKEE